MDYIEVSIRIQPYSDENADIVLAEIDQLGFESYVNEEPFLKAYIQKDLFSEHNLKTVLSGFKALPQGNGPASGYAGKLKDWSDCKSEGRTDSGTNVHDGNFFTPGDDIAVGYTLNFIPEQNWNASWESDFEPVVIDRLCTIKAPYHHGLPRTRYTITIKPEMAFGTGHHQTTTMMVEFLLREGGVLADKGNSTGTLAGNPANQLLDKQLLDMGCGTGILSILAAKLKCKAPVHAIDIDPVAVRSARENASKNRTGEKVKTLCGDASLIQADKYDFILANINRNILLEDMSTYCRGLKSHGTLIVSGFYVKDIPMLVSEAQRLGLEYVFHLEKEDWAAVKFVK